MRIVGGDLADMLAAAAARHGHPDDRKPTGTDVQARVLRDLLVDRLQTCPFAVGDLVEQRPEYVRYRYPDTGQLAIVSHVGISNAKVGDETWAANDMVVLVRSGDAWVEFAVESWRFKKYEGKVA